MGSSPARRDPAPRPGAGAAVVLDVDQGAGALIRQLRHGRAQTFGYLSRVPGIPFEERRHDPVIGPLLDRALPSRVPRDAAAAWLRHRWHVEQLVSRSMGMCRSWTSDFPTAG